MCLFLQDTLKKIKPFLFGKQSFFCNHVLMSMGNRIESAMYKAKMNQTELASAMKVTPQAVQQWIAGTTTPKGKRLSLLATVLGVSVEFLVTGAQTLTQAEMFVNVAPGPNVYGKVPLISWVQAGHASEVVDLLHPGDGFEWIDTTCQIKRHTYALRVRGDSMSPDFPDGSVIIVEPEFDPLPGDYVIAKNGDDEATFKQLIKDGADYYLKPLNERYPIKPIGHYHVIGVVRQLVRQFR